MYSGFCFYIFLASHRGPPWVLGVACWPPGSGAVLPLLYSVCKFVGSKFFYLLLCFPCCYGQAHIFLYCELVYVGLCFFFLFLFFISAILLSSLVFFLPE